MPSTVNGLMESARLRLQGPVQWGTPVPYGGRGVYIVSVSADPCFVGRHEPHIDETKVAAWLDRVPGLTLDELTPSPSELVQRLASFWLPDESILYIGKAGTSVGKRVSQYYRTELGRSRPHAGGHWIKTLGNLNSLYVFWAATDTDTPEIDEACLLAGFVKNVSPSSRVALPDPSRPFPFANLEFPHGNRKQHGIGGATR